MLFRSKQIDCVLNRLATAGYLLPPKCHLITHKESSSNDWCSPVLTKPLATFKPNTRSELMTNESHNSEEPQGFIVSNGDLSKGFYFYGVFKTYEEAFKYGKENFDYSGFIVHELHK